MLLKKVAFIAKQLPEYDPENIHDVILGNITKPDSMVDEVMVCAQFYDSLMEKNVARD